MIEVTLEPDDLPGWGLERCCLCRAPTRHWHTPKDVACCLTCANSATPDMLPSKQEWMAKERALNPSIAGRWIMRGIE